MSVVETQEKLKSAKEANKLNLEKFEKKKKKKNKSKQWGWKRLLYFRGGLLGKRRMAFSGGNIYSTKI